MSLIQVPRSFQIKDNAYAVLWDARDEPRVKRFFLKTHKKMKYNQRLAWLKKHLPFIFKHMSYQEYDNTFRKFLEARSNDHRVTLDGIEDIGFYQADDMVTYNGLARFCQLIMKTSTLQPTHMGIGTNASTALATQTTLVAEVTSAAFATAPNYAIPNSTTLEMVINWPTSIATNTYREISVRDQQAVGGSRMFSRNVLTTPFAHTINVTTFTTSVVIEFIPIVS